jgi:hypothetical protein
MSLHYPAAKCLGNIHDVFGLSYYLFHITLLSIPVTAYVTAHSTDLQTVRLCHFSILFSLALRKLLDL